MDITIINAMELSIRSWGELMEIRDRLEGVLANPDDKVKNIIEIIHSKFEDTSAGKVYPRGFWRTNKVLKTYILVKKAYEHIGLPVNMVIKDHFRPYCSVGIERVFGNTYKMLCLITGKRIQLSDSKNYAVIILESEKKLKKFSNIDLTEIDMIMLGFRDMLHHYLYNTYEELFKSMNIDHVSLMGYSSARTHVFNIFVTPKVSHDSMYNYIMAFYSIMQKYKIDCNNLNFVISPDMGIIDRIRTRRNINGFKRQFVELNISHSSKTHEPYFDILINKNLVNTKLATLNYLK